MRKGHDASRDKPPAAALALAPGERVLAAARTVGGQWVVGTDRHLHLPDDATPNASGHLILAWERIDAATWHVDDERLIVQTLPIEGLPPMRYDVALPDPGRLPELVRERVTSTILVNQRVALVGRLGARIVGRRAPGKDQISWTVVYERGVDADDPAVADRLQVEFSDLRSRLGV